MSEVQSSKATKDLVAALAALENVGANRQNPAFKAKYVSLDALLDSVKATLKEHDFALRQVLVSEDGRIGVQTSFLHIDGTVFDAGKLMVKADGLTPQQVGSALTYVRRQSIQTACGISTDLDDDGASASGTRIIKPSGKWYSFLSPAETSSAFKYCVDKGWLSASQDIADLPADKIELINGNRTAFIKAINK